MIRSGELKNWAEAARLIGITRARMTQIGKLMLLAPDFQQRILSLPGARETTRLATERELREVYAAPRWNTQRSLFQALPISLPPLGS